MNGSELWTALRREFKKLYPTSAIHRFENTLERGIPDVVLCANGKTVWVELKGTGDKESPLQRVFRTRWAKAGGRSVVLEADGFVVKELHCQVGFDSLEEAIIHIVDG